MPDLEEAPPGADVSLDTPAPAQPYTVPDENISLAPATPGDIAPPAQRAYPEFGQSNPDLAAPQSPAPPAWGEIESHPRFAALPPEGKQQVLDHFLGAARDHALTLPGALPASVDERLGVFRQQKLESWKPPEETAAGQAAPPASTALPEVAGQVGYTPRFPHSLKEAGYNLAAGVDDLTSRAKSVLDYAAPGFLDQATTSPFQSTPLAPSPGDSRLAAAGKASYNAVTGFIGGVTSPAMLASGGLGEALGATKLLAGGFAGDMASHLPQQFQAVQEADKTPKWSQARWEAGLNLALGLALVHGAGSHATAGELSPHLVDNVGKMPDDILHAAAGDPGFKRSAPQLYNAVAEELGKRDLSNATDRSLQIASGDKDFAKSAPTQHAAIKAEAERRGLEPLDANHLTAAQGASDRALEITAQDDTLRQKQPGLYEAAWQELSHRARTAAAGADNTTLQIAGGDDAWQADRPTLHAAVTAELEKRGLQPVPAEQVVQARKLVEDFNSQIQSAKSAHLDATATELLRQRDAGIADLKSKAPGLNSTQGVPSGLKVAFRAADGRVFTSDQPLHALAVGAAHDAGADVEGGDYGYQTQSGEFLDRGQAENVKNGREPGAPAAQAAPELRKPSHLLPPDEYVKQSGVDPTDQHAVANVEQRHVFSLDLAIDDRRPVSAAAADRFGISPKGYVRQGELLVPEEKAAPSALSESPAEPPPAEVTSLVEPTTEKEGEQQNADSNEGQGQDKSQTDANAQGPQAQVLGGAAAGPEPAALPNLDSIHEAYLENPSPESYRALVHATAELTPDEFAHQSLYKRQAALAAERTPEILAFAKRYKIQPGDWATHVATQALRGTPKVKESAKAALKSAGLEARNVGRHMFTPVIEGVHEWTKTKAAEISEASTSVKKEVPSPAPAQAGLPATDDLAARASTHFDRLAAIARSRNAPDPEAAANDSILSIVNSKPEITDDEHLGALLSRSLNQQIAEQFTRESRQKRGGGAEKISLDAPLGEGRGSVAETVGGGAHSDAEATDTEQALADREKAVTDVYSSLRSAAEKVAPRITPEQLIRATRVVSAELTGRPVDPRDVRKQGAVARLTQDPGFRKAVEASRNPDTSKLLAGPGAAHELELEVARTEMGAEIYNGLSHAFGEAPSREQWQDNFLRTHPELEDDTAALDRAWVNSQAAAKAFHAENGRKPMLDVAHDIVSGSTADKGEPTTLKNEQVNKERIERGMPALVKGATVSDREVWTDAAQRMADDPTLGHNLIAELKDHPRATETWERGVILKVKLDRAAEFDAAYKRYEAATASGEDAGAAKDALLRANDALSDVEQVSRDTASVIGRSLRFQRVLANEDYSLARMVARETAAKGDSLTPEEIAKTATEQKQLEVERQKAEAAAGTAEEKRRGGAFDESDKQARTRAAQSPKDVDLGAQRENIIAGMKKRLEEGDSPADLYSYVQKLHENLQREAIQNGVGALTREEVTDEIHRVLTKELGLDLPKKFAGDEKVTNTEDLISGIGLPLDKSLTTDPAKLAKSEVRTQLQKVGKINRYLEKMAAPKTGPPRLPTSAETRALEKEGRELAKTNGVQVTDPAKQLATSLEAKKTRLRNEIADIDRAIALREPRVTKTGVPIEDAETKSLEAQRDAKKKEEIAIFGDPKLTDEARLKVAIGIAERTEKAWNERLADAKQGVFSKERPGVKITGPQLEAIKARTDAVRAEVAELKSNDAALSAAKDAAALESKQKALQKEIETIRAKIGTAPETKGTLVSRPGHPELEPLLQERDKLRADLAESRKKPELQKAEEAQQRRLDYLNDTINERLAKLTVGDLSSGSPGQRVNRPLPPELETAQQQLDKVNQQIADARRAAAKQPPEVVALKAYKTRLATQTAALQDKLARNDFTPPKKREPIALDTEAKTAKVAYERLKQDFEDKLYKLQRAQRTLPQKIGDAVVDWSRNAKLLSWHVYPKLLLAAATKVVADPVGRVLGQPLRVIPGFAEKAPYELGLSMRHEITSIAAALHAGPEAWKKLTTGRSNIDIEGGKRALDREMTSFIGNSHGLIKEPIRQGAAAHAEAAYLEQAARKGFDPHDPIVQTAARSAAIADANRRVFMGDNMFSQAFHRVVIGYLKGQGRKGTFGAYQLANTVEFLMPIVKVSTNIGIYQTQLATGLPEAFIRIARAASKGELANRSATLSQEDAGAISRAFKLGLAGVLLGAYAWNHNQQFGGEFEEEGRKKTTLKPGEIQTPFGTLPGWLNHTPEGLFLNTVASARRVHDRYVAKNPNKRVTAATNALAFITLTPVKHMPFIDTIVRNVATHQTFSQVAGQQVRDAAVPNVVSQLVGATDKVKRDPKSVLDEIEMGIPGLRQQVPAKQGKASGFGRF